MKKNSIIILTLVFTTIICCKNNIESSGTRNLSEYKRTQFIPTLESKISEDMNSVYCATLLFAWDEIRKQINSPLKVSDTFKDLTLINQSESFKDVLKKNEFKAIVSIDNYLVTARAEFEKSLQFEIILNSFKNKLKFYDQKVSSFGVVGHENYDQLEIIQIVYYLNDNNFIIKLLPEDKKHEIILFKTEQRFNTMGEMTDSIVRLTEIGKKERGFPEKYWKYQFRDKDVLIIPKFNFDIKTYYSELEGNKFSSDRINYTILNAWQRTAFTLDERGAKIKSEVEIAAAASEELEEPKPKKMIFDKRFLILLKRTDSKEPYYGLWTTNSELMVKE